MLARKIIWVWDSVVNLLRMYLLIFQNPVNMYNRTGLFPIVHFQTKLPQRSFFLMRMSAKFGPLCALNFLCSHSLALSSLTQEQIGKFQHCSSTPFYTKRKLWCLLNLFPWETQIVILLLTVTAISLECEDSRTTRMEIISTPFKHMHIVFYRHCLQSSHFSSALL